MRIFATGKGGLEEIRKINFRNEREIQRTVEDNLALFFPGLELVKSECTIQNTRIDTLAFDKEATAFVIIEYKTAKRSDIYSQGRSYHNVLRKNKERCVWLLSKKKNEFIDLQDVDWQKTRLIFVMPSFTARQIEASDSEDLLDIKLYEIRKYPDCLIMSRAGVTDDESDSGIIELSTPDTYSEADWLDGKYGGAKPTPQVRDLYFALKNNLVAKFQLEHVQQKRWASFRLSGTQVCSVVLRKHKLQITYSTTKKDLLPLNDFINDVSGVGRWGRGNYRSDITTKSDISRAIKYVDLVYNDIPGSGRTTRTTPKPAPNAYSEADWLAGKYGVKPLPEIRDLYFVLKTALIDKFQFVHVQRKLWASFRLEEGEVCSVVLQKSRLRIVYSTFKKDLLPLNDFINDVSGVGKLGRGNYRSDIKTESDISTAMQYVDIVYKDVSGA